MNVAVAAAVAELPGPLPPGERVLWAARPTLGAVLRHLFHLRAVLVVLALLAIWPVVSAVEGGYSLLAALPASLLFLPFGLPLMLFIWLAARIVAGRTLYVVTDRRVILHVGYVFTRTINIPLAKVRHVALRRHGGDVGDLQLDIDPDAPVSYATLLPHTRLARVFRPAPLLRVVPEPERAAALLVGALAGAAAGSPAGQEAAA